MNATSKRKLGRIRRSLACVAVAGGLVAGLAPAQPAAAEIGCSPASSTSGDLFTFRRCNMPDIDQRRRTSGTIAGLPGDGDMYCVPTAAMDLLAYIATHGYPYVAPGTASWTDPANYNTMSNHLKTMGSLMGTSATGGTGHDEAHQGLKWWLGGQAPGFFTVTSASAYKYWAPTATTIAKEALAGNLVEPIVGWYKNADGAGEKTRDGGHALSLTGIEGKLPIGEAKTIRFRDPATDSNYLAQSSYAHDTHPIEDRVAKFNGWTRWQSRVVGYGSAYLDGYFSIKPKYGLTADSDGFKLLIPVLAKMNGSAGLPASAVKALSAVGTVTDVAVVPVGTEHAYLVAGDPSVWRIDTVTGRSTRLATLQAPRRLVVGGPENAVFVLQDRELVALDHRGGVTARVALTAALDDIAYDSRTGQVLGLAAKDQRIHAFDRSLRPVASHPLAGLPVPDGRVSISVDPTGTTATTVWATTGASGKAFRIQLGGPDTRAVAVALESVGRAGEVHVDDQGHLFLTDNGLIRERTGDGRRVAASIFEGMPGGVALDMIRNFSNFDPTMTGPAYRNVLPEDATA